MTSLLEVKQLVCHYGNQPILSNVSFQLKLGEIGCILGPSGCGKSTLLRTVAGFHPVSDGEILLDQQILGSRIHSVAPEKRRIGMVFQDYALFPHLNVMDNVRFGLGRKAGGRARALEMLQLVGLADLAGRYPHELSGGQQQRIALARALAPEPRLILMDEPFSNLDVELRKRLSLDIRDILKKAGISAILVTHDQQEAFAMSDHIGIIHQGHLIQWDTAYNLYHEPASRFVANFVGRGSFLPGTVKTASSMETELGIISGSQSYSWPAGQIVDVLFRPDDVVIDPQSAIRARIVNKIFAGSSTLYRLQLPSGRTFEILAPSHQDYAEGEQVGLKPDVSHLIAFERVSSAAS